jgi:hypothetical protein
MRIQATLEQGGKTATGVHVPDDVVAALGSSRRPAVKVTFAGHTYRTSIASMRGRFMLPVSAQVREQTGVAAGDALDIEIELDTEPREVTVPDDLAAALEDAPAAGERFERLSYSHKQRYVLAIEGAKAAETRARRIAKTVEELGTTA